MIKITKQILNSPSKFQKELKPYISKLKKKLRREEIEIGQYFNNEEIGYLLLSVFRSNDFKILIPYQRTQSFDERKLTSWFIEKLIPNTVLIRIDDPDIIRLLIFSLQITYQMFEGGTLATVTQRGFRERERTFETIVIDQFTGKLGEIGVKKFLKEKFNAEIKLIWEISPEIYKFRSDIADSKYPIGIKSTSTLSGIWAEADKKAKYGIFVKCSIPRLPLLQFFIEACGFSRLLNFADKKIPPSDKLFSAYLRELINRVRDYKCGEFKTNLKMFICGYFKTRPNLLRREGKALKYLGQVREQRYLIEIDKLKYLTNDWKIFLDENKLI